MNSPINLASLQPDLLMLIFSQLSDADILTLPMTVIAQGLTDADAKSRYANCTISLDRSGLTRIYHLCTIPYISTKVRNLTILTDRVIKPTTEENYLCFQHHRHNRPISRGGSSMREIHGFRRWDQCDTCNGLRVAEQYETILRAAQNQREVEKSETKRAARDLTMLAYALKRLINVQNITIESSLERTHADLRARQLARFQNVGLRPSRDSILPECSDWDLQLDKSRLNVLLLKALLIAKEKRRTRIKSVSSMKWISRAAWILDDGGYWSALRVGVVREQQTLLERAQYAEGRERDTEYAFHIWENCLLGCRPKI